MSCSCQRQRYRAAPVSAQRPWPAQGGLSSSSESVKSHGAAECRVQCPASSAVVLWSLRAFVWLQCVECLLVLGRVQRVLGRAIRADRAPRPAQVTATSTPAAPYRRSCTSTRRPAVAVGMSHPGGAGRGLHRSAYPVARGPPGSRVIPTPVSRSTRKSRRNWSPSHRCSCSADHRKESAAQKPS